MLKRCRSREDQVATKVSCRMHGVAPRNWSQNLEEGERSIVTKTGFKQSSYICPALFTYSEDGDINKESNVMLGSHVDDLLFACKPGYGPFVTKIQKALDVDDSKLTYKDFRFCGHEG